MEGAACRKPRRGTPREPSAQGPQLLCVCVARAAPLDIWTLTHGVRLGPEGLDWVAQVEL